MPKEKTARAVADVEQLISQMRTRPCLWDLADPKYCKRDYQRVAWMELADVTHAPVNDLRKRWRALRDTFARELRRLETSGARSTHELEAGTVWRYFTQLLFLRRAVRQTRQLKKEKAANSGRGRSYSRDRAGLPLAANIKLKRKKRTRNSSRNDGNHDSPRREPESPQRDSESLQCKPESPKHEQESPEHEQESPKYEQDSPRHELESPEREPERTPEVARVGSRCRRPRARSRSRSRSSDGDTQFLLSLVPFLREVPRHRKLLARARLTQVLIDEQSQRPVLSVAPHL